MKSPHKVVILGGGFAGVYGALSTLRHAGNAVEITVINRRNYFLFTPMLHEVATGSIGHHQPVESLRQIIYKTPIRFLEAEIESVDLAKKEVHTSAGVRAYDTLVIALGASTNFFGTPGAAEHAFVLKDLLDAIRLRNHVIDTFEKAAHSDEVTKKRLLSFAIVGGGATGVELAAELAEFARHTLRKLYHRELSCDDISITVVQSAPELLPQFSPESRARALERFENKNIRVLFDNKVASVDASGVALATGERVDAGTVVWTAGVKANQLATTGGELPKDKGGRIMADATLAVPGFSGVYALGDIASVANDSGKPYPMLAQIAVLQAKHVGKNIARAIAGQSGIPFAWKSQGELVSLGRWQAVGTVRGVNLYGRFAWFVWRTVYLFKFISWSKKFKIALDWTVHLFFPRDITRA